MTFADGSSVRADRVVLALGNLPPRDPALADGHWPEDPARYVARSLAPGRARAPRARPGAARRHGPDDGRRRAPAAGRAAGHAHRRALARRAASRRHIARAALRRAGACPSPKPTTEPARRCCASCAPPPSAAEVGGGDWRDAVNALRPVTPELWAGLLAERAAALRRPSRALLGHPPAPPRAAGRDGGGGAAAQRRADARERPHPLGRRALGRPRRERARARDRPTRTLHVASVVNCTGPTGDVLAARPSWQRSARPAAPARTRSRSASTRGRDGALRDASGQESETLFALGPLRRGELWETTAVAEIRAQAIALAQRLVRERALAGIV